MIDIHHMIDSPYDIYWCSSLSFLFLFLNHFSFGNVRLTTHLAGPLSWKMRERDLFFARAASIRFTGLSISYYSGLLVLLLFNLSEDDVIALVKRFLFCCRQNNS